MDGSAKGLSGLIWWLLSGLYGGFVGALAEALMELLPWRNFRPIF